MKFLPSLLLAFFAVLQLSAQPNVNGELDAIEDLSTTITVPIEMPDGVRLMTDISVPVTSDSLMVEVDLLGTTATIELIPRGTQLIIYDSLNNEPNPNPYQLPMVFTRSPYNKSGDPAAYVVNILGYAYALQDMRGRYSSEGVYFPMLSDSWSKTPYHPDYNHIADVTNPGDLHDSNEHEDGYNTVQALLNVERDYDLDGDGIAETTAPLCNGSIGMFGASALGNTQLQAAAAHRIDPTQPGLKCLLPIVATTEHYKSTGTNNGVFRERIVTGWIRGQVYDMDNAMIPTDLAAADPINNSLHTAADYMLGSKEEAAEACIDHLVVHRYPGHIAGSYPNGPMRTEMDASFAPVDENGDGAADGQYSRYTNYEVPIYHLTGWWDIFINGQIETHNLIMENLSDDYGNKQKQKIVIGPWAHQTTGSTITGDREYPGNSSEIIGVDLDDVDLDNLDISAFAKSEVISWYRYNLNYQQGLGEPKVIIPESDKWQPFGAGQVRVPSKDYIIPWSTLINVIAGGEDLPPIKVEISSPLGVTEIDFNIPDLDLGGFGFAGENIAGNLYKDYTEVPAVRFYVVGPVDDGVAENANVGNYWFGSEHFPLTEADGINMTNTYLHASGLINFDEPQEDEGSLSYVHDPDDPVLTVGGANMIVRTPQNDRNSQGQMNLADPDFAPYTMDREGVIEFETAPIQDSLTIMGFPKATLYASSTPDGASTGPTDTDFFVRILDVYPDGGEYFVVEGAVNARGREYARSIYNGNEDPDAPYTNIEAGEIYEYQFELLPIAYTWGKGHRMKVLISSSNYNRYQVNPNLPMEDGDFFRRTPGDGRTYNYNGTDMAARVATNRIYFSGEYASRIELPVYNQEFVGIGGPAAPKSELAFRAFPNPANQSVRLLPSRTGEFGYTLSNALGQVVAKGSFADQHTLNVAEYPRGVYFVELIGYGEKSVKKLILE